MELPEGFKRLFEGTYEGLVVNGKPQGELKQLPKDITKAEKLLKEMAEALEKVQAIAEMTMPNGSIAPLSLYKDVTPVLKKFKEWK